jgi:ADP-ribose pyrophosphatase YjhB (NUDIX family)
MIDEVERALQDYYKTMTEMRKALGMKMCKVAAIIYDREDNLLIVKSKISDKWGFPKGYLYIDETPEDGVLREVKEETGLSLTFNNNRRQTIGGDTIAYYFQLDAVRPKIINQLAEIRDSYWLNINNIRDVREIERNSNKILSIYLWRKINAASKYWKSPVVERIGTELYQFKSSLERPNSKEFSSFRTEPTGFRAPGRAREYDWNRGRALRPI